MEKRTREIIALVLLVVLGLAVAGAMAWYIFVGHSWNQAATHIDDMVGSMEGYTVILYEGDVERPAPEALVESGPQAASSMLESRAESKASGPNGDSKASKSSIGSANSESTVGSSAPEPSGGSKASKASDGSKEPKSSDESMLANSGAASSVASDVESADDPAAEPIPDPVGIDEVKDSYEEKGARVVVLGSDAMTRYLEPSIVKRNGIRIGIFSFPGKYRMRYSQLRGSVRYLQRHQVDLVIAIANDKALIRHSLEGIDLLVLMRDAQIPEAGIYRSGALCTDSPYEGEVQALIVSPSGVLTSRTVREL